MLGHFGFSYMGVIFLLLLFVPNIIWSKNLPDGYENADTVFPGTADDDGFLQQPSGNPCCGGDIAGCCIFYAGDIW